ncbi:hypothetical protein [Cellulomonas flavigena]|uniref:hypothetical protein n=1 Tax=Cellulomonas flavigena TaxID=1711 RepID=UPI0011D25334|nr:hypothetical protein [Cellulomonas flavigena]
MLDPVGGDPQRVRSAGQEYARVARQIGRSADDLRAIATEVGGGSAAVEEVAAKATRLADTIERAHGRYAAAGEALQTYADQLADAREIAYAAHASAARALLGAEQVGRGVRRLRERGRCARPIGVGSGPTGQALVVVERRSPGVGDRVRSRPSTT